jgi:hypothetical protein
MAVVKTVKDTLAAAVKGIAMKIARSGMKPDCQL